MPHLSIYLGCLTPWLWCHRITALKLLWSFATNIWCQKIINSTDDEPDLAARWTTGLAFFLYKFCFPMFYLYGVRTPESLAPGVERISEGDMLVTHCPGSGVSWVPGPLTLGMEEGSAGPEPVLLIHWELSHREKGPPTGTDPVPAKWIPYGDIPHSQSLY